MGWDQPENDPPPAPKSAADEPPSALESRLFERMSFEFLREQRAARRWGIFFKLLAVVYVSAFMLLSLPSDWNLSALGSAKVTALVDLQGVIAHGNEASADNIVAGLRAAFENSSTAGVVLRINSPGGSPVQAGYINDEIYRLREKYPGHPHICGGRGHLRFGRLLRGGGGRQNLCRQGQPGWLHRRAHGRLRLC